MNSVSSDNISLYLRYGLDGSYIPTQPTYLLLIAPDHKEWRNSSRAGRPLSSRTLRLVTYSMESTNDRRHFHSFSKGALGVVCTVPLAANAERPTLQRHAYRFLDHQHFEIGITTFGVFFLVSWAQIPHLKICVQLPFRLVQSGL